MELDNHAKRIEKSKSRRTSNKLLKDIEYLLRENHSALKENNDMLKRKERLLFEIKEEVRKIRFNTIIIMVFAHLVFTSQ